MDDEQTLVVGASGDISRAVAEELAGTGRSIVLWGRRESALAEAAVARRERGGRAEIDLVDVAAAVRFVVTSPPSCCPTEIHLQPQRSPAG